MLFISCVDGGIGAFSVSLAYMQFRPFKSKGQVQFEALALNPKSFFFFFANKQALARHLICNLLTCHCFVTDTELIMSTLFFFPLKRGKYEEWERTWGKAAQHSDVDHRPDSKYLDSSPGSCPLHQSNWASHFTPPSLSLLSRLLNVDCGSTYVTGSL